MNQSSCLDDYLFGPQTSLQCRDGLDLTLVFEESMLSLLPASAMIAASFARVVALRRTRKVVLGHSFYDTKAVCFTSSPSRRTGANHLVDARLSSHGPSLRSPIIMDPSSTNENPNVDRSSYLFLDRIVGFRSTFQIGT